MSDCSMQAMEPKQPRTCGTCGHVRETRLNCFYAANDRAYYAGCTSPDAMACEHYVDDPDSLQRRYERLAQVAREMFVAYRDTLPIIASFVGVDYAMSHFSSPDTFLKELIECGVSVDD